MLPGSNPTKPTVLVVEDHEDTRYMLRVLLEMRGYRIVEAENGAVAIDMAESVRPDLILIDSTLPRLDGLSAIRRIRELPGLQKLPIILMTGYVTPEFLMRASHGGCDECLIKPLNFEELENLIGRLLAGSANPANLVAQAELKYSLALRSGDSHRCVGRN